MTIRKKILTRDFVIVGLVIVLLISVFLLVLFPSLDISQRIEQKILWEKIVDTTWWKNDGWAGESFVFYEDYKGDKKCIYQKHGSGVYIIGRKFCKFDLIDEEVIKIDGQTYQLNRNMSENDWEINNVIYLREENPVVYWRLGIENMEYVRSKEFDINETN